MQCIGKINSYVDKIDRKKKKKFIKKNENIQCLSILGENVYSVGRKNAAIHAASQVPKAALHDAKAGTAAICAPIC